MATPQPRRLLRRLADAAVNLVLVAAILLAAAYILPSLLGYDRYVITGGSMSGTFEKGSIAFERQVPVEDLRPGDVITYQPPTASGVGTLVTHRIVRVGRDDVGRRVFRTQGDANPDPDPWRFSLTDPEQPVVAFTVPYAGHAFIALADRRVRMAVVGGPALLVALMSLLQLTAALRERRAERVDDSVPNCGAPVEIASDTRGDALPTVEDDGSAEAPVLATTT